MKRKLLGCSAALLVSTCALAQVPNADTQEGKEMQIQVHSYMSEHPSVSIDDAITRLAVQGEVMSDIEALRIEFADRLTELSIKDAPDQHILVQLKGPDPVAGRTITTESGTTRVVFEVGHKYTQDEFYALLAQHRPLLHSAIPGITGTTGFPGEDRVLIDIKGDSGQAEELKDTIKKLERVTGLKIEVRPTCRSQSMRSMLLAAPPSNPIIATAPQDFRLFIRPPDEEVSPPRRIAPTI